MANTRKKNARTASFILGLIVVLLAIFGAITLIILAGRQAGKLLGDSAKRAEYEEFLSPIVRNDPDLFDNVSQASQSQLIDCTIWKILQSNMKTGKYETVVTPSGAGFQIPKADVEAQFAALFGTTETLEHDTVDGGEYIFTYDRNKQIYLIPITAIAPIYTPRVTNIQKKSRTIVLTVGYIPAADYSYDDNGNVVPAEPNKYRKIVLSTTNDGYYVTAIQPLSSDNVNS